MSPGTNVILPFSHNHFYKSGKGKIASFAVLMKSSLLSSGNKVKKKKTTTKENLEHFSKM